MPSAGDYITRSICRLKLLKIVHMKSAIRSVLSAILHERNYSKDYYDVKLYSIR